MVFGGEEMSVTEPRPTPAAQPSDGGTGLSDADGTGLAGDGATDGGTGLAGADGADGPGGPEVARPADSPSAAAGRGPSTRRTAVPARTHGKGPVFLAAAATAGWAALVSFLPLLVLVALAWLVDGQGNSSVRAALRFAGAGWLLGHGVPVGTRSGPFALAPLGLTALIVWRLVRAGAHTARAVGGDRRAALAGALGVAVGYGLLAALVAVLVSTAEMRLSAPRAFAYAGLLALVSAVTGAVRETGMGRHIAGQFPPHVRYGLRSGVMAACALLAAGALVAGAAVAWHADDAAETMRGYQAGAAGDAGITLICLIYAPTLAVWAVSYLAGPGFAVGTGTAVGVAGVRLGPVPAIPVLAGLPSHAAPAGGTLLLAVPLLIGAGLGVLAARRQAGTGLRPLLLSTVLTGVFAGVLLAVAGMVASGSLGSGRLATLGPSWWQLGLAVTGLIGVAASIGASIARVAGVRPQS